MSPSTSLKRSKRRAYSRPLNREKIANAAIEIVREEGQGALSMRKVAGLFGVDVAALYRHFRNKDELLGEVGRIASEMAELHGPTEGSWEDRFVELCHAIRDRIARHPELGLYGGGSPWATPFIARANGLIAALFCEAGLRGQELVFATQTVLHLVTLIAQSEILTRDTPRSQNRAFAETIRAHLPEDAQRAWPATRERDAWSIDFDALFEFAMRTALDSIVPGPDRPR